jgi:hypothetical protein
MKKDITIIYNAKKSQRKIICELQEDDTIIIKENVPIYNFEPSKTNTFNASRLINVPQKKGIGEVVASFTKLFGYKPCAPCNKRRRYLNEKTPIWMANIIAKFYK